MHTALTVASGLSPTHTTVLPDIRLPNGSVLDLRVVHESGDIIDLAGIRSNGTTLLPGEVCQLVGGAAALEELQESLNDRLRLIEVARTFHPALAAALAFLAPRLAAPSGPIAATLTEMAARLRVDHPSTMLGFANGVEEVTAAARHVQGDSVLDDVRDGLTRAICDVARGHAHSDQGAGGWLVMVARQRELMESRGELQAPRAA